MVKPKAVPQANKRRNGLPPNTAFCISFGRKYVWWPVLAWVRSLAVRAPVVQPSSTMATSGRTACPVSAFVMPFVTQAVLSLFEALSEHSTIGFNGLLGEVMKVVQPPAGRQGDQGTSKQVINSVAQVVATLCMNATPAHRDATIKQFCDGLDKGEQVRVGVPTGDVWDFDSSHTQWKMLSVSCVRLGVMSGFLFENFSVPVIG